MIKDLSLSVEENTFTCILGPSGCGKTTLLRCIAGFEDYAGEIFVDDVLCKEPGIDRIMVFQDFNQLFPWKTVIGNIKFALKKNGVTDASEQEKIAKEMLEKTHLSGFEDYYPHQLSGGMKQRVAIAKALALKPRIILMDEPFAALDAMTRTELQNEVLKIFEENNITFIFITHNIQEAIMLGDRIIVLGLGGEVLIDEENHIQKPVTPASNGYGDLWKKLHDSLYLAKR